MSWYVFTNVQKTWDVRRTRRSKNDVGSGGDLVLSPTAKPRMNASIKKDHISYNVSFGVWRSIFCCPRPHAHAAVR